jgi:class 3 adenylate cyclase/predicted ATPase
MEDWLRSIGLGQRIPAFRANGITADQRCSLTDADLRELGLTIGERLRFRAALAKLARSLAVDPHAPERTDGSSAERRPMTTMFVDIIGSSNISARLDPEDLIEVYETYRDLCGEAIRANGGYVASFAGDGILAYFGYPQARENDPARAARAALGIVRKIGVAVTPAGGPIRVRIGIATGRVLVSRLFAGGLSAQDVAVGSTLNLAARLQNLAGPNGIVASEQTYSRIQAKFICEPVGEVILAGFESIHHPWRIIAERSQHQFSAGAPVTWNSVFQGRRGELEVLRVQWSRTERGDGAVALIVGDAGIGKSRLIDQFLTFHLPKGTRVVRLAASALDEDSPFFPFIDFFRARFGVGPSEPPDRARDKIAARYEVTPGRDATLPILSDLLGISSDDAYAAKLPPRQLRAKTLAVLTQLLLRPADGRPLCLVFEDLHWLDPSSQELLEMLARRICGQRILLLLSTRSSKMAAWVAAVDPIVLHLQPLSLEDSDGLLRSLFGDIPVPPQLARRVAAQTEGVPLFIEAVAHMLLEQRNRAGPIRTPNDEMELRIPASLDEALVARLDRSGAAKSVAQAASVFGGSVRPELLAAVCDVASGKLLQHLAALVEADILEEAARGDCGVYRFRHVLLRDAAYASLVRGRRKELHVRAARALAALDPSEAAAHPDLLAVHLSEGGLVEDAVPHWLEAARRSLARSALDEATRVLRRALIALERLPVTPSTMASRLHVSILLGPALSGLTGHHSAETRDHYRRAHDLCRQLPEDPSHFPIYWGWSLLEPLNIERATALLDRAATYDDPELLLQAHHFNWACRLNTASFERCCEHLDMGLSIYHDGDYRQLARSYGNHDPKVCAHGTRLQAYWMQGKLKRAMEDERQALFWAREIGHVGSRVHALGSTLLHRVFRRDYKEVFDRANELTALAAEHGLADHGAIGLVFRGWVVATQSDAASGIKMLEEGWSRLQEVPTHEDFPVYLCLQAEALAAAGHADKALEHLVREQSQFIQRGLRVWLPEVLRMTGEMSYATGFLSPSKALTYFSEAAEMANAQGAAMLGLRIAVSEARLDMRLGALDRATSRVKMALDKIMEPDGSADLLVAENLSTKVGTKLR